MSATLTKTTVASPPIEGQKPGTSGLRKKVAVFMQPHYLENFVQATFNALREADQFPEVLVVGGDGRFGCKDAAQTIVAMAAANGVAHVIVGQDALLSTPAVSALVRTHADKPQGAFILTASHNPGGPKGDFGVKYNCANGGPAPEKVTDLIFQQTTTLQSYETVAAFPAVALGAAGTTAYTVDGKPFQATVVDSVSHHAAVLRTVFDFGKIKALLARPDFTMVYDGMHGVGGPYARAILVDELGAPESALMNCVPSEDFNAGHPDPNLTYAPELVKTMGLTREGTVLAGAGATPSFGAAADGDADRNMILGAKFFVSPSDSLAVIAANATECIPFFAKGLKSVARSMPTSGAVDVVAKAKGLKLFEVPTGWKFFGNLMDSKIAFNKEDFTPLICGEESFGTGSNHVREKDGMWAVLAWLSILAHHNADAAAPLVTVEAIVEAHWKTYGRNYYCRYDYEEVDSQAAADLMEHMRAATADGIPALAGVACDFVDDFKYEDPVDGSVSAKQGIRVAYKDGSRFVLRLSGTGSSGATIRLYIEQIVSADAVAAAAGPMPHTAEVLKPLVALALEVSKMKAFTGRDAPTVIT